MFFNTRSIKRWIDSIIDIRRFVISPYNIIKYCIDYSKYVSAGGNAPFNDSWPIFNDWTTTTSFDSHYTYLNVWAFSKVKDSSTSEHIDVGSQINFVTLLSTVKEVVFIDIRPLEIELNNLHNKFGSVLELPFPDNSVHSLSSLHVIEHIGLGRYGDPVDPRGTEKAIRELSRVLALGGNLYIAVPIGAPRTCFNAHRILNPRDVINSFAAKGVRLKDFSVVTDEVKYLIGVNPDDFTEQRYACGMFHFIKLQNTDAGKP